MYAAAAAAASRLCADTSSPDTSCAASIDAASSDFAPLAAASSNSGLERTISPILERAVRDQVYRSLTKIERYFGHRDPNALRSIFGGFADNAKLGGTPTCNSNQNAQVGRTKYLVPPPQPSPPAETRMYNFQQRRMEQDHIDLRVIDHIKIPEGIALRSLIVPQPPDALFADDYPEMSVDELLRQQQQQQQNGFEWLDSNVSNAEQCSRRAMSRELVKQTLDDWVYLYFRVQKRNWESTVVEEKKNAPDVNMYAEDQVHKWTLKLRFKLLRIAPIKMALNAFLSRMGLESNPNIVFCRDGFYGLMDVGNIYGELNKTPCSMISFNSTSKYLGLKNGDSIFVNSVTSNQRQMMEDVPRQEGPKKKSKDGEGEGEEGEFEFVEEGEDEE